MQGNVIEISRCATVERDKPRNKHTNKLSMCTGALHTCLLDLGVRHTHVIKLISLIKTAAKAKGADSHHETIPVR